MIARNGTGSKHALYYETTASTITSDYNNLFVSSTGGTTNAVGYNGTNRVTLADWQNNSTF